MLMKHLLGLRENMNCRRAQSNIALWAGNDLDETDLPCLQRHLEACPECREYKEQMHALMQLVEECPLRDEVDEASKSAVEHSLWPSLSTRLVETPPRRSDRFNGWVPAVAVAVVCLAMVLIASPPQASSPHEAPQASVESEGGWSGEVQEAGFSETARSPASQRIQEPIQIFPVRERRPQPPRVGPPNLNQRELERRRQEYEAMRSLLMHQNEYPRFSNPQEMERRFREFEKMQSLLMNPHGITRGP